MVLIHISLLSNFPLLLCFIYKIPVRIFLLVIFVLLINTHTHIYSLMYHEYSLWIFCELYLWKISSTLAYYFTQGVYRLIEVLKFTEFIYNSLPFF